MLPEQQLASLDQLAANANTLIRNYVAAHANCYLVDLAKILADPADQHALRPNYNSDNLHPNQSGADAMAAAIADQLLTVGLEL